MNLNYPELDNAEFYVCYRCTNLLQCRGRSPHVSFRASRRVSPQEISICV